MHCKFRLSKSDLQFIRHVLHRRTYSGSNTHAHTYAFTAPHNCTDCFAYRAVGILYASYCHTF